MNNSRNQRAALENSFRSLQIRFAMYLVDDPSPCSLVLITSKGACKANWKREVNQDASTLTSHYKNWQEKSKNTKQISDSKKECITAITMAMATTTTPWPTAGILAHPGTATRLCHRAGELEVWFHLCRNCRLHFHHIRRRLLQGNIPLDSCQM
jgi:hypothetical protein